MEDRADKLRLRANAMEWLAHEHLRRPIKLKRKAELDMKRLEVQAHGHVKTSARNVRRRVTRQKTAHNGAAQENVRNVRTRTVTTAAGVNVALPNIVWTELTNAELHCLATLGFREYFCSFEIQDECSFKERANLPRQGISISLFPSYNHTFNRHSQILLKLLLTGVEKESNKASGYHAVHIVFTKAWSCLHIYSSSLTINLFSVGGGGKGTWGGVLDTDYNHIIDTNDPNHSSELKRTMEPLLHSGCLLFLLVLPLYFFDPSIDPTQCNILVNVFVNGNDLNMLWIRMVAKRLKQVLVATSFNKEMDFSTYKHLQSVCNDHDLLNLELHRCYRSLRRIIEENEIHVIIIGRKEGILFLLTKAHQPLIKIKFTVLLEPDIQSPVVVARLNGVASDICLIFRIYNKNLVPSIAILIIANNVVITEETSKNMSSCDFKITFQTSLLAFNEEAIIELYSDHFSLSRFRDLILNRLIGSCLYLGFRITLGLVFLQCASGPFRGSLAWSCYCGSGATLVDLYHGGTNFGRTAGGPFIATSYDHDAPLDEFDYVVVASTWHVTWSNTLSHQN
ncbi:beta-galactosidase [Artemisia annua]|uniref:Beta-galactosidase n=1 Tax=Artemisia annua TaxID=35608 RepID=A0A2U1PPT8_ARTAN|nr:beta-galactosidase [Artemisia annua]